MPVTVAVQTLSIGSLPTADGGRDPPYTRRRRLSLAVRMCCTIGMFEGQA